MRSDRLSGRRLRGKAVAFRRHVGVATKTCAAVAIIFLISEIVVFALPSPGDPADADLIYVIGPPTPQRISVARQLISDEKSGGLLVSVAPPGGHDKATASKMQICSQQSVICESPTPMTTKGEALMLVDYARTHEVHKVAVITFTPHVARTRYIFARCAPDIDVQVIGVDEHLSIGDWVYQFAYQTTAFVKAAATPCASDDE